MESVAMFSKSLKLITLGLMGAIALNAVTPTITPAKDAAKQAPQAITLAVKKAAPSIWEQLNLTKEQKGKLQAIRTKRTVALEPMPPYERRIVHMALRSRADVQTKSVGEGNSRKVTIVPR